MKQTTDAPQGGDVADMLCFAIYSAQHAFNQFYRPLLDRFGLTYPQYLVMVALWASDGRTVKQLGAALRLESNTLTPVLKRLEAQGYVTRQRDPEDERQVRVRLTEAGRAIREEASTVPQCVTDTLGLGDAEMRDLVQKLAAVRDRLAGATRG